MHPETGQPTPKELTLSIPRLISAYYTNEPERDNPLHKVSFGTSGHRGVSEECSFNEAHILAICQAVCDFRKVNDITGPLFLGMDTHALSEAAFITAIEVLAANDIKVYYQQGRGYTPTPVISHAIINFNLTHTAKADGLIITPSHNPPNNGGIKYNPPHGGPAENKITAWITERANSLIDNSLVGVAHIPFNEAFRQDHIKAYDYITPYVSALDQVIDMKVIQQAGIKIGADPLGGAGLAYWEPIADYYNLDITVVNKKVDPSFSFMTLDKDGQIRMDCSSPWVMQPLIHLKDSFDLAIGNDPDFDRHGIVTKQGLMNANDYLAVMTDYIFRHRNLWSSGLSIGKTVVTTSLINRIAKGLNRKIIETPVGFKWYEKGLSGETTGFACEESAGATFLQRNGKVWTTDKDGFTAGLLAAEIMAKTDKTLDEYYQKLTQIYGKPFYSRTQVSATPREKQLLAEQLTPEMVKMSALGGDPIEDCITKAPSNDEVIGGIKLSTKNGWITARPSGTEPAYKIYAESFKDKAHLQQLQKQATSLIEEIFQSISDPS